MAVPKVLAVFLVGIVLAQGANVARPKPGAAAGGPNLGVVIPPSHMGWGGWIPSTQGWTTPPPETTTTPGWSPPETTTGWPAPGWPADPTGWPAPAADAEIELYGESAVLGAGEAGATHGNQISVSGDGWTPAIASFSTGSYASLGQGSGLMQATEVGADGSSSTFQGIDSYNFGDAGDYAGGTLMGTQIDTAGGGGSYVLGEGWIAQGGYTENDNDGLATGWKSDDKKQ